MAGPSAPDLVKVTEIYLVPSSFLVAALGTADSNPHRAAVSLIGLIVSVFWWISSREAFADAAAAQRAQASSDAPRRILAMHWLSLVFGVGWLLSLIVHLLLWNQRLGN